jgi:hypothetical protein
MQYFQPYTLHRQSDWQPSAPLPWTMSYLNRITLEWFMPLLPTVMVRIQAKDRLIEIR